MPERLLFPCTHGPEAPERATVPFIAAATAAASGKPATVILTIEGSNLALPEVATRSLRTVCRPFRTYSAP